MTAKIDPKRELKQLYSAQQAPELVDVPELSFLMIDGHGDPNRVGARKSLVGAELRLRRASHRAMMIAA